MRFLVDAQLPARLVSRLAELGHDVVHTSFLPDGNRTTDQQIAGLADRDGRIVVTKDADLSRSGEVPSCRIHARIPEVRDASLLT